MAYWRPLLRPGAAASLFALLAIGCADASGELADDSIGGPMNDTLPPWSECDTDTDTDGCATGTTSDVSTTGAPDNTCASSEDCTGNSVCAATFDMANEEVGMFECQFTCIAELDDSQWCRDDGSCCDPGAVCTARGYCIVGGDSTTDGTTTDSDGSTTDGTDGSTGSDTDTDTDGTGTTGG